jgi:ankyrin repeat protein
MDPLSVCLDVAAASENLDLQKFAGQLATTGTKYYRHPAAEYLRTSRHVHTYNLLHARSAEDARHALRRGADPNAHTAIHRAVHKGFVPDLLAHPDFRVIDDVNDKLRTALQESYFRQDIGAATALLRAGADPNIASPCGCMLLHYAAENNHLEFVDALVRYGAHLDAFDCRGNTALHLAISGVPDIHDIWSNTSCLRYLLHHPHTNWYLPNKNGLSPLAYAVLSSEDVIVTELLDFGIVPDRAAFEHAAAIGALAIFDALVDHAVRPVTYKKYARIAASQGHIIVARRIMEYCQ